MSWKKFGMNMMSTIKTMADNVVKVAVIGGGAAGMCAASAAAKYGASVVLFEKNKMLGKKLRITGKGRCNVTNDCSPQDFMANIPQNPRFLWSAINRMASEDVIQMFEDLGVPLKTERGKRVFPVSDRAGDIAGALVKDCQKNGVEIRHEKVINILAIEDHILKINTDVGEYLFDSVIICTGGLSYPLTGSDGDGYKFAKSLGHHVTDLKPSLVPLVCDGEFCAKLQGLSLKNVALKIENKNTKKVIFEDFGEMLFTHYGISGPMVLSASAHIQDINSGAYVACIDLKPALDDNKLDQRILSDFKKYSNRDFINALDDLLPQKMIDPIVEISGIDRQKKVNLITKEERRYLGSLLKCLKIRINGFRPISEAIITRGGVDVKEINPKTMESKLIKGLFFAGEVIDVDGYTGGFNLQIAFSTGVLAGENAAVITK